MAGMKMIKVTAKTEFTRHELLKQRLADGFPGVTQLMVDSALASATSLLELEFKTSAIKFQNKYGGEDWYKCMRALYDVVEENQGWRVISNTRDWDEAREWVVGSKWEAEDKINQLMAWRESDVRRGQANPDCHIERGTKILEERAAKQPEDEVAEII